MRNTSAGAVIIDTSLDLEGVEKASRELLQTVEDTALKAGKELDGVSVDLPGSEKTKKELEELKNRLADLKKAREETEKVFSQAAASFGRDSIQAAELQATLSQLNQSIAENEEKTKKLSAALDDAAGKNKKYSQTQKDVEKTSDAMGTALGHLIANGVEKTISAIGELLDKTKDLRRETSLLETSAEMAGLPFEAAELAAKRFNVVAQDSGAQIEAVSALLAAGVDENQLAEAVDILSGAVVALPGTMQIENIAESLQESVSTGKAVGQVAELLERYGVSAENLTQRLSGMGDESQRLNYLLMELADTGLADYYALYREKNPDLVEAADAQFEYNRTLAALAEVLQPLETELLQGFTKLVQENGDTITRLAEIIFHLLDVVLSLLDVIAGIPPDILEIILLFGAIALIAGKLTSTFGGLSGGVGGFTTALDGSFLSVAKWIALIGTAVVAVSLLLYLIIALAEGTEKAGQAMDNFKIPSLPDASGAGIPYSRISGYQHNGYASGTQSAKRGWSIVGENGPELAWFSGGEKILTANQTMATRLQGPSAGFAENYYFSGDIILDAKNVEDFQSVVRMAKTARQTSRAR